MDGVRNGSARAVADLTEGLILASVEIDASPERVFRALVSQEIIDWWVRPEVFDTREWTGEVRVGGRWRTSGFGSGRPYELEGEYLDLDPPTKLMHTWHLVGMPGEPTIVTYVLDETDGRTRITLRHSGFASGDACRATCIGWETSFEQLEASLAAEPSPSRG